MTTSERASSSAPMVPRKYARSETMTPGFDRTIEICGEHLSLDPRSLVLDVPCGKGEALIRLANTFSARCVGVDRSPELVAHAARKIATAGPGGRAQVLLADGGVLPFADATFDACLSIGGPSCIGGHSSADAIAEQARVLKPNGLLVASDMFRDAENPNPWIAPDHPDALGWWRILEDAGLRVVCFEHFEVSAWDEYHAPMFELVAEVRREFGDDPAKMDWARRVEEEIAIDRPAGTWANYGTLVAEKP